MKFKNIVVAFMLCTFGNTLVAEILTNEEVSKSETDANLVGHVTCNGEHIPFASVMVKGTTIGTTSDETGHFQLINLPPQQVTIMVSMMGYQSAEKTIILVEDKTLELKFDLKEDVLNLNEVVVSADRNAQKRTEASVIVNTISPKLFTSSQSITLGEGLNFAPGLRLENNCQNCGFSQVRMNGMEGPYSQILINSRPIFSGLAGVYGLELIPSNMIEKVEVVRGGGSALFGSNAIAGTINIILKDPISNTYQGGYDYALTGVGVDGSAGAASDNSVNFNASVVSDDKESGLSLYGFTRNRHVYDANDDGFSEIAPLKNLTFGARAFHRFNYRDKLTVDFFAIQEDRQGGNKQDLPHHERDISESVTHDMKVAALTYERFFREYDRLTVFASGQLLDRDSYYGANQSMSDYGLSSGQTYSVGAQYKALFQNKSSLVFGVENVSDFLKDEKLGYPDYENAVIVGDTIQSVPHVGNTLVADQTSTTTGVFAQYDVKFNRFKISAGGRYDHYEIIDALSESGDKSGDIFSPRLSVMYDVAKYLQWRTSYSQGYRAPQIFDEDLHLETSGSRQVEHRNDANLKQETSHSYMTSLDFNKMLGKVYVGFLVEGFYTHLVDAFANEIGAPDENGRVIYKRVNSDGGAVVQGVNMELKLRPLKDFSFTSGFTIQRSEYEEPEDIFGETRFFRTPDTYGFFSMDWDFHEGFSLSTTGNYTGSMLVPHYDAVLVESDSFFELGAKLSYKYKLNGASVEFSGGVKNILNSYQSDFDRGADRDPSYIYGPMAPRTVYLGVKFGNIL